MISGALDSMFDNLEVQKFGAETGISGSGSDPSLALVVGSKCSLVLESAQKLSLGEVMVLLKASRGSWKMRVQSGSQQVAGHPSDTVSQDALLYSYTCHSSGKCLLSRFSLQRCIKSRQLPCKEFRIQNLETIGKVQIRKKSGISFTESADGNKQRR